MSDVSAWPRCCAQQLPYVVTKTSLITLGTGLNEYATPLGIGVTVVCPYITDTDFGKNTTMWSGDGPSRGLGFEPGDAHSASYVAERLVDGVSREEFMISLLPAEGEGQHK